MEDLGLHNSKEGSSSSQALRRPTNCSLNVCVVNVREAFIGGVF